MSLRKKIYITGCAKTGTTLVRRLFNAFDLKVYNKNEMYIYNFINSNYDVSKRISSTIFSDDIDKKEILKQINTIKKLNIVNVVRNKEDVLKSDNNYVSEKRYDICMQHADKYKKYIDFTINYDELIANPNKIQEKIIDKFNIKKLYNFNEYPNFINIKEENNNILNGIYKLRKIK